MIRRLVSAGFAVLMALGLSAPAFAGQYLTGRDNVTRFTDVSESAYYYDAVKWAVEKNITTGTTRSTFSPNELCTRAQAVTFLWRAIGSPAPVSDSVSRFRDVPKNAYFRNAVSWTTDYEVVSGKTDTIFDPEDFCTRGQFVTMLYRYTGGEKQRPTATFSDVFPGQYYYDAALWAADIGVTNGTSDMTFEPNGTCTRAQVVTFLYRFFVDPIY